MATKSELKTEDLFRLEAGLRVDADVLRKAWPANVLVDPEIGVGMRELARRDLDKAKGLETTANLLMGLQGCWNRMSDEVRNGYKRMAAGYEQAKAKDAELKTENAA